jgi:hypothetical protein
MEDLAAEFNMKTQVSIYAVKCLLAFGYVLSPSPPPPRKPSHGCTAFKRVEN